MLAPKLIIQTKDPKSLSDYLTRRIYKGENIKLNVNLETNVAYVEIPLPLNWTSLAKSSEHFSYESWEGVPNPDKCPVFDLVDGIMRPAQPEVK